MPLSISCLNTEQVPVTASPNTGGTTPVPAPIEGALVITIVSGDGTFTQDAASPLSFKAVSGSLAGDTVYDVAGDADMSPAVQALIHDTVILTVTIPAPVASDLGLSAGSVEPKP